MASNASYTTISSWMSCVHRVLKNENLDADALFKKAGLPLDYAYKQDLRVGIDEARAIWRESVLATSDDAFGLKVALALLEYSLDPVSLVVESSATLGEAMERFIKFYQVVSNGVLIYQQRSNTSDVYLTSKGGAELPAQEAVDAAMGLIVKRIELLSSHVIKPIRIEFVRGEPKNIKAFKAFFGCELYFNCDTYRVCYPLVVESMPLVKSNESLSSVLDEYLDRTVKEVSNESFILMVSTVVNNLMPSGVVTLNLVAKELKLGVRLIQRNLKDEGTTFKEIVSECRLATAKKLLGRNTLSITDVAFSLGFSSPSNFVRFFKRLQGCSPKEYQVKSR